MSKSDFGIGVYYDTDDYAGFFRRLIIICVDLFVFCSLISFGLILDEVLYDSFESYYEEYCTFGALILTYIYLTVIKISRFGTFGLALTNCKIVSIYGKKPSMYNMSFRFLFLFLGPVNLIIDLMWLTLNPEKRTVRDCYSQTYVIRKNSKHIGESPVHLCRIHVLGAMLMYPTVSKNHITTKRA
ncbi:MAG: RDD family protein [Planctomycetes bacterium]|nr:RDD family protein [Planctomycetota bacterium]